MTNTSSSAKSSRLTPHVWVSSTYFAEGFSYSVVNSVSEIMFKEFGASLRTVGLTSIFHLPWNLKFLWGPLVDAYATKRRWMIWTEIALSVAMVGLAATVHTPQVLLWASVVFFGLAVLSATQDIAIDGYYLEALDRRDQSKFVGYRAMAYRVAQLLVAGPLLIVIARFGWSVGLIACTAVMALLTLLHAVRLPRVETPRRSFAELGRALLRRWVLIVGASIAGAIIVERRLGLLASAFASVDTQLGLSRLDAGGWIGVVLVAALVTALLLRKQIVAGMQANQSNFSAAYLKFLEQPRVGRVLAFIILFRTGESFLLKMRWPFLRDTMNMSLDAYGMVNGTVGVAASFVATFVGGWLIARHGLRRWLWPFLLAQNTLNLSYWMLAEIGSGASTWMVAGVIVAEHVGAGLGTAVFMVYIMRCCHPDHKAAHMAIVTAIMSVGFSLAGLSSGYLAEAMGFSMYFVFTFVASVPAMLLALGVPHLDEPPADEGDAEATPESAESPP